MLGILVIFHITVSYFYPWSIYLFGSSFTVIFTHFSNPIIIRHFNHVIIIIVCIERKSHANFQLQNFCTHRPPLLPPCIICTYDMPNNVGANMLICFVRYVDALDCLCLSTHCLKMFMFVHPFFVGRQSFYISLLYSGIL